MPFTQETFAGASIISFTGSIGWGDNPSSVTIQLVEDASNGDVFTPPSVGDTALFSYQTWGFAGIIQSWKQQASFSGNPTYEVVLQDPREVLSGTKMILSGYNGSVAGVPNLYNVYGYIEDTFGFGSAGVNEAGIKWGLIKDSLIAMSITSSDYGGPLALRNSTYKLNLSALPSLPEYYRIPAENMSVMDFIKEVCDAANHDFYFHQTTATGIADEIILVTANRNIAPNFGSISGFIATTPGAIQKDSGFEFRNELTSKYVVGGGLSQIYLSGPDGTQDPEDEPVWPYWGFSDNGELLIGIGTDNEHQVTLPAKWLRFWPYDTYQTDIGEIRAAEENQEAWESYLWLHNWNYWVLDPNGTQSDVLRDFSDVPDPAILGQNRYGIKLFKGGTVSYTHSETPNPHFGKATILGLSGMLNSDLAFFLLSNTWTNIQRRPLAQWGVFSRTNLQNAHNGKNPKTLLEEGISVTYEYLRGYATQFYGRKFMVRMPFMLSSRDSETGKVITSQKPTDSGFIEESAWDDAIANNLLPLDVNKMTTVDGKILAYVRFDNASNLDLSGLVEYKDYILNANGTSAFVLCQVDENVVYIDNETLFSPRVVITLPNAVRHANTTNTSMRNYLGVITNFLDKALKDPARPDGAQTQNTIDLGLIKLFGSVGADKLKLGSQGLALLPDVTATPLESNIQFYGPWYAVGANGPIEFEKDDSLVPWNYGGFSAMNNAGNAKVVSSLSLQQISEKGSVQFPGVPAINLGGQLAANGPYITDINVNIGPGGATTTYNMSTWEIHPYTLRKSQADFQARIHKLLQQRRRNVRNIIRQPVKPKILLNPNAFPEKKTKPSNKISSSKTIIGGQLFNPSGDEYSSMVAIQSDYDSAYQLIEDLTDKSFMSLDGLFRPVTTDYDSTYLAHFESGVGDITSAELNPFSGNHDIQILTQDNGELIDSYINDREDLTGEARFLALRAPVIMTGWGYDTEGNPVPASGSEFIEDYKRKSNQWKTGPLDVRWDDTRKVWAASSTSSEIKHLNGLRLSLVDSGGSAGSEGGLLNSSTIYLSKFHNKEMSLYDGDSWELHTTSINGGTGTTASINISSHTTDAFLMIFAYPITIGGSGFIDIDAVHNAQSGQSVDFFDGVAVHKSGSEYLPKRRYVGLAYTSNNPTTGTGTVIQDNHINRHIFNFNNRYPMSLYLPASGASTLSANTFTIDGYLSSAITVSGVSFIQSTIGTAVKDDNGYYIECNLNVQGSGSYSLTLNDPTIASFNRAGFAHNYDNDGYSSIHLSICNSSTSIAAVLNTVVAPRPNVGTGNLTVLGQDSSYLVGWVYQ